MTRLVPMLGALLCALATAAPAGAAARHDYGERTVVRAINAVRAQHGLPRVLPARDLARAADAHSRDMRLRGFFAHSSSDGTPFRVRVRRYSRRVAVAETLASVHGPDGMVRVVPMWMGSPPHRAILLGPAFRRVGVARRGGLWTAEFGSLR